MESVLCVKKRGSNWSEEEEIMLIEVVLKVEDTLFGKMNGCPGVKGKQNRIKESMWSSITETLNLHYKKERETECVNKKFHNTKQRAKDKISQYRHPKTGGGPAPPNLTTAEDALLQAFEGRPQIVGIDGGVDTDGTIIDNIPLPSVTSGHPDIDELLRLGTSSDNLQQTMQSTIPSDSILTDLNSLGSCVGTSHTGHVVTEKKKKRNMEDNLKEVEIENLKLDNERMKVEIEKLKVEKRKLEAETDLIAIKKAYFLCKLQTDFPACTVFFNENESNTNEM